MAKKSLKARITQMKKARDHKVAHHLTQYAPIWLVDDTPQPDMDSIQFEVVFYHPTYAWVKRRYLYDAFTDVLYQRGQVRIDEDEAIEIQASTPYIEATASNSVLSYGG
jgi:hypothetical protein